MAGSQEKNLVFQPAEEIKEERNPVIFLHAMLCSKEIWTDIPQRVANATGRRVYTYDARCHGQNKDLKDFSFEALVEDLYSFMTERKLEKAVLVGHSMGGKTAMSVALKSPEKVEKVLIVDMFAKAIPEKLVKRSINFLHLWRDCVLSLPDNTPVEDVTKESVSELYTKLKEQERMESEKQALIKSSFVYPKSQDGKYDMCYNAEELREGLEKYLEEHKELVGEYTGPAYFLFGTESPYKIDEEEAANIGRLFPNAEMIPFHGAPHHIFVHSPDEFGNALVEKINLAVA